MQQPSILIGMPLFHGWDVVAEALHSIQSQSYRNYRLLISVDGADQRSFAACEPHLSDPRVEIVTQPKQLGWGGNVTWLAERLREDFFCYWQHDDLCDPSYLQRLVDHAERHPEASAVYCEMQYFGESDKLLRYKSIRGFALQRVLTQIRRNGPAPIRCLIRSAAMRAALPITQTGPWVVTLAREGELHCLPEPLYFRRESRNSVTKEMLTAGREELRATTLEWGLGVLEAAMPAAPAADHPRLLLYVADQLINHRPRRRLHYDASSTGTDDPLRFLADFLQRVRARLGLVAYPDVLAAPDAASRLADRQSGLAEGAIESLVIEAMLSDLDKYRDRQAPRTSRTIGRWLMQAGRLFEAAARKFGG